MYKFLSTILHPVFVPTLVVFGYLKMVVLPEDLKWLMFPVWVIFVSLILPGAYLKLVRKDINIYSPGIKERWSIYKLMMLVYIILTLAFFIMEGKFALFMLAQVLLFFLLYLLSKYLLKASWHAAAWAQLAFGALITYWHYPLKELVIVAAIATIVTAVIYLVRLKANAHSHFELLMGMAAGIVSSIPILFASL